MALLLLQLLACAARDPLPVPSAEAVSVGESEAPEPLPAPFSAAEIRDAFRPGQHLIFGLFAAGQEDEVADWLVTGWTEDEVTIAFTTLAADGVTVLEPTEERTTRWDALRDHAVFPDPGASRARGVLVHPLGTLDVWLYTVPGPDPGMLRRYWFAEDLPGPPIRFTITLEGVEVFKMEQQYRSTAGDL